MLQIMGDITLRAQCSHFRVLSSVELMRVKTTILKKVCNTTDEPRIYDRMERGMENIVKDR